MQTNKNSITNSFPEGQYKSFQPIEELQPFIEEFWIHSMDKYCSHNKHELEQPSLSHEIIFKYGQDFEEYYPKNKDFKTQTTSIISGIRTFAKSSKRTDFNNSLFLIGIKFKPLGMYTLLNLPLFEFYNRSISFSDSKSLILEKLEDGLSNLRDNQQIINFLNHSMISFYCKKEISTDALVFYNQLQNSNLQDHSTFIKNSDFHYKYLERKFKKYIGITPKKYLKIQRYLSFYNIWFNNNNYDYIDTVYKHNYFDQSHLIKDFKSVMGVSPNTFLKSMNQSFTQNIRSAYPNV